MFGATLVESFSVKTSDGEDSTYAELRAIPPGLLVAGAVSTFEGHQRQGADRVRYLQALARQVAHYQALFYAAVAEVGDAVVELLGAGYEDAHAFASDEIGAALTWTRRAADLHLGVARDLIDRLPDVWAALRAGTIDLPKARVICDHTSGLQDEVAREVAALALEQATECTPSQLRGRVKRLAIESDTAAAENEYAQAVEERRVWVDANPDGTATLLALNVPADRANAALDRVDRLARLVAEGGDERTMDQIRADVTLDLLEGRHLDYDRGVGRGVIDIRVDLEDPHRAERTSRRAGRLGTGGRRHRPPGRCRPAPQRMALHRHRRRPDRRQRHHPAAAHRTPAPTLPGHLPHLCLSRVPQAGPAL